MVSGSFDVRVDTPKTAKRGTVTFTVDGASLRAELELGELGVLELAGTHDGNDFTLEGSVEVAGVGTVDYDLTGSAWGNSVDVSGATSVGKVEARGTSVSAATGDVAGRPRSMYAGRWSDGY